MEEEFTKIERKDGIVYQRKKKEKEYDTKLNIRINQKLIDSFKEIAQNENIKYQMLIRNILEEFVQKYK